MLLLIILAVALLYLFACLAILFVKQTVLQAISQQIRNEFQPVTGTMTMETKAYRVYKQQLDANTEILYYVYYNLLETPYPFLGYRDPISKITKAVFIGDVGEQDFKVRLSELSIFNYKTFLTNHE
jgi:predicted membrane metal-binding protein